MFEFLRTWAAERGRTSQLPPEGTQFPERFRGRPSIEAKGLPVLDLGACLFSPEEASEADGCQMRYTQDYRCLLYTSDAADE